MTGSLRGRLLKNVCRDVIIVLIVFSASWRIFSPSFAASLYKSSEEISIKVKAERLKFNQENGVISAKGSVEAKFDDVVLQADEMLVDTKTNMAIAQGSVSMRRGEYEAKGSKMIYNLKSDTAYVKDFKATVSSPDIKGNLFVKVEDITDEATNKTGSLASVTSCDLANPHYFMMAKEFYYRPDDKVVGSNVTMYVGGVPVMWLPFYIYDLAKRRVSLLMPII
jgi:lipopolysaccharide assembly outer membrane protein LptD (OstA)